MAGALASVSSTVLALRELVVRLDVHHSWIGRVAEGERRVDVVEFARLCTAIGCDPMKGSYPPFRI
ncbi:MAG: hypothetical protein HN919_18315 [Verrucomicrobia bacterium]|jgi:hypothetical protein|nr:hypothetical protein [Verrucomicrobiota bacterium]MBT7068257.1 hypothetical protein [Verrucomicrobiota bacterium]MBT7699223.1 hypothetical protein [Verrucomicrobiota bacterium]